MIDYLKKHGLELVGAFWLVVVAVQYLSSYFVNLGLDFKPVYYAMLVFTTGVLAYRIFGRKGEETHESKPRRSGR